MTNWKFGVEKFGDIYEEMRPLLDQHYLEVAHYQDIKLDPDLSRYNQLQAAGVLHTLTAREVGTHRLIGYALFFVAPNLHYRESLQAVQDIIFIEPKHRGFGTDFIRTCDEYLKLNGVQAVYHHIKVRNDWSKILKRQGYEAVDMVYGKRLDK